MTSVRTITRLTAPVNTASITISLPHTELGHTNLNRSQSRNFSSSEISVPLSSASSSSSYRAVCLYPEGSNPIERTEWELSQRETTLNELPDNLHTITSVLSVYEKWLIECKKTDLLTFQQQDLQYIKQTKSFKLAMRTSRSLNWTKHTVYMSSLHTRGNSVYLDIQQGERHLFPQLDHTVWTPQGELVVRGSTLCLKQSVRIQVTTKGKSHFTLHLILSDTQ